MKISIVTISFNQARFLERAIKSVIEQRDVDLEYIVVDAGSTDGSRGIIEKYSKIIDRIIFENDNGPADGLNKGFSYATGDIYGFLNSDDYLLPDSLKNVVKEFKKYPNADVISGNGYLIDREDNILHSMFSFRLSRSKLDMLRFAYSCSCLVQQSTFFRKKIFVQVGGFDNNFKNIWDGAIFLDFALNGATFKRVHDYWSCFRIHPDSVTGSGIGLPTNNFGAKYYELLQKKVAAKEVSIYVIKFIWIIGWLSEPIHLLRRIVDQIKYPKRYL